MPHDPDALRAEAEADLRQAETDRHLIDGPPPKVDDRDHPEQVLLARVAKAERRRVTGPWTAAQRQRARHALRNAVRRGDLVKGPCEVCGTVRDVQGHHDDYGKPLDVRWLCRSHHRLRHRSILGWW